MYNITGSGSDNYTTRMGPGNPLNQGGINFLNRYMFYIFMQGP